MAAVAFTAELPSMAIVPTVTVETSRRCAATRRVIGMTVGTGNVLVFALQRIIGVGIVVKPPDGPVHGGVAAFALFTQCAVVMIVLAMAIDTSRVCFRIALVNVTGIALHE